jgi:hypothetical protein
MPKRFLMAGIATALIASLFAGINCYKTLPDIEGFEVSSGWTVTSYCLDNETVYSGNKVEVFDSNENSLGFYKTDFLEQIKIDGGGKGDGIQNPGKIIQYDYDVNDGKTCYISDKPTGAYGEVRDWNDDKPTVAVNPPLPDDTEIRFIDLGHEGSNSPDWVIDLLESKTFYVKDTFFNMGDEKRIDVYVGLQKVKDMVGTPESLLMHNVIVAIKYPNG